MARNLVNLSNVGKRYADRWVLEGVSLGVSAGERIGVVGRNGDGKSTLIRLIAGAETPDAGTATRTTGLDLRLVSQGDELSPGATVVHELAGDRAQHEWAGDPRVRDILDGLFGGVTLPRFAHGAQTLVGTLSGGERRRLSLAKALIEHPELLLLDEPTNHLDLEAVAWLAGHLTQTRRSGTLVVVTHDRWFLDAVTERTWEVVDAGVEQYDGGYAAYVLARAERDRQAAARDERRRNLLRKELAWLRRGPPARTSKPKFRIDAANALIADEPPARDTVELVRFAAARLGKTVVEAEHIGVRFGEREILRDVTWRLGPGERVALMGPNGAGKSTLLRVLEGVLEPTSGNVVRGGTVRFAQLTQDTAEIDGELRVVEALAAVRQSTTIADGKQVSASQLAERFGFRGAKAGTRVRDLSGGERRRLQLMRLLLDEPNVLVLDEPTNDLDIDTLIALEDLLDSWPGTLVVVSHDRYFLERVTDDVYALVGNGRLRHLPGGVEQYVDLRHAASERTSTAPEPSTSGHAEASNAAHKSTTPKRSGGEQRATRKESARLERLIDKLTEREADIHERMAAAATDFDTLRELQAELASVTAERDEAETRWLELDT